MSDTLRSHLEAIRDDWSSPHLSSILALRLAVEHAVAALEIIDNADRVGHGIAATHTDRLIPDPVPVVSPRPNQQETP